MSRGLRRLGPFLLAVGLTGAGRPVTTIDAGASGGIAQVTITGMKFVPAHLRVKVGQRIRWTNEDLVPHTVTATDHLFDSTILAPSASWEWQATKAGDFSYGCVVHPTMIGSVTAH